MSAATLIHDAIWTGATGRALREHEFARTMMFYLLTCPEKNPYGLFAIEMAVLGVRIAGTERDFARAMTFLEQLGFCRWDTASGWVWVIEMAHYQFQTPLKPNDYRNLSVKKWYRTAPANPFIGEWFDRYEQDFHLSAEPQAVERRAAKTAWVPKAPIPAPPPGASKPLSTDLSTGFDLVQEQQEQRPLLPVDPATVPLRLDQAGSEFERLWGMYPNGKQKKDARELFLKLKPTPALVSKIEAAITAHARSHDWTKDGGQFCPRMVNWLKREGWNDRVAAPGPVVNERTMTNMRAVAGFASRRDDDDEN